MISVLMGVYNCEKTVVRAIESILNQTVSDWELIICDDGSTDNTYQEVMSVKDDRIKVLRNKKNHGLAYTLNRCFAASQGEYLARMDGDDTCAPDRFEKELSVLKVGMHSVVSSGMYLCDEKGKKYGKLRNPQTPTAMEVVVGNPIFHAPCMMTRECFEAVGGYNESRKVERVEDVDLWIRLYAKKYRAFNVQEYLYNMTNGNEAVARRKYKYRVNSTRVRLRGCKVFHLPAKCYLMSFKPMLKGIVPSRVRKMLKKVK